MSYYRKKWKGKTIHHKTLYLRQGWYADHRFTREEFISDIREIPTDIKSYFFRGRHAFHWDEEKTERTAAWIVAWGLFMLLDFILGAIWWHI